MPELASTIQDIQEDVQPPVIQVHTSQVKEVKVDELSSGKNDRILASNPTKDLYEYFDALFSDLKPINKEVVLLH